MRLAGALREHLNAGTPADDPAVQQLSRQWDELAAKFHGDNAAIKVAAATAWTEKRAAIGNQIGWPSDDGLVDYVNQARASR